MLPSVLLAAAGVIGACSVPPSEVERQASLPYAAFESEPSGWRHLSAAGCTDAAVLLLEAYAAANRSTLSAANAMELSFHAGQVLALAGREAEAIDRFERSLQPEASAEWSAYVRATLAFLRKDLVALQQARAAYAAIAPKSLRLRFIEGFAACPNEPYAKAVHCRL